MNKKSSVLTLLLLPIIGILGYYISHQTPSAQKTVLSAQSISQNSYPDSTLTPGDVFPDVTASEVCKSGYTKEVRNVSVSTKHDVYTEYGLTYPQPRGAYEVDHFIPLELGGSNDLKNLWPEPANPTPGFHQKDVVENYLHDQVCRGSESLQKAQKEIQTDWYAVYRRIPNPQIYDYGGF